MYKNKEKGDMDDKETRLADENGSTNPKSPSLPHSHRTRDNVNTDQTRNLDQDVDRNNENRSNPPQRGIRKPNSKVSSSNNRAVASKQHWTFNLILCCVSCALSGSVQFGYNIRFVQKILIFSSSDRGA
jgi:hypothetical protein